MIKKGFDNALYIQRQTEEITKRISKFDNKLYLEFGGKLFDDYHASRVLPGFDVNGKVRLLQEFRDKAEIIFCISAADIESNKIRADIGITYDMDVLRLIDSLREMGLMVSSIVITRFNEQPSSIVFKKKLEMRGEKVYLHRSIDGYPTDIDTVVSENGYGKNPYIETTRPLVAVTAPGPGSGKLATCLSQIYHEYRRGVKAGYAKFETFPIWNIPLKHPVNLAYEAATADLKDVNMIDSFHLDAYGKTTVNYNRDLEVFPIVKTILEKCAGISMYKSPTDMGVNMAGYGIVDDDAVRAAASQEIIRRYYAACCDYKKGRVDLDTVQRVEMIMKQLDLTVNDRKVVAPALAKSEACGGVPAMSLELPDGQIITGREKGIINAPSAAILNAVKSLAGIKDDMALLSPVVLDPMSKLKSDIFGKKKPMLGLSDVLSALSICAATNTMAAAALAKLSELRGCEAHLTVFVSQSDEVILKSLGVNITCEANFPSSGLYFA